MYSTVKLTLHMCQIINEGTSPCIHNVSNEESSGEQHNRPNEFKIPDERVEMTALINKRLDVLSSPEKWVSCSRTRVTQDIMQPKLQPS